MGLLARGVRTPHGLHPTELGDGEGAHASAQCYRRFQNPAAVGKATPPHSEQLSQQLCAPCFFTASVNCSPKKSALSSRVTVFTIYLLFRRVWAESSSRQIFPTHLQTERADLAERVLLSHQGDHDILQHHQGTGWRCGKLRAGPGPGTE